MALFAALIAAAAFAFVGTAAQPPFVPPVASNPNELKFFIQGHFTAQHSSATAPIFGLMSNETLTGVRAAFFEANTNGGVAGGKNLTLKLFNDGGDPFAVVANGALPLALATDPSVLGIVTAKSLEAQILTPLARNMSIPVFGPTTSSVPAKTEFNADYLMHTAQPVSSEGSALINFAVNSDLHCKTFFMLHLDLPPVQVAVAQIRAELLRLGLSEPIIASVGVTERNISAVLPRLLQAYLMARVKPTCFILMVDASYVLPFIGAMFGAAGPVQFDQTYFLTTSTASLPNWFDPTTRSAALFKNVFITASQPSGLDTRWAFVQKYQAALQRLKDSGTLDVTSTFQPNAFSVDGYMAGRFLIEAIERVPLGQNITRKNLKDAVYRTKFFNVDDFVLAPFSNGCEGRQTSATGACWCTSGSRQIFFSRVNGVTGVPTPVLDTAYATGVAEVPVPLTQCDLFLNFLQRPTISVFARDTTLPSLATTAASGAMIAGGNFAATSPVVKAQATMIDALRKLAVEAKASGKLTYGPVFAAPPAAAANITGATVEGLVDRYRLVFLIGSVMDPAKVYPALAAAQVTASRVGADQENANTVAVDAATATAAASGGAADLFDIAPASAAFVDRDMPWQPFASHLPLRIPFYPTLTDFALTAAAFASKSLNLGGRNVVIVSDTAALSALATKAVETRTRAAPAGTAVVGASTSAAALPSMFAAAAGKAQPLTTAGATTIGGAPMTTAVIVVTRVESVLNAAIAFAALPTSASTAVILAADEFQLEVVAPAVVGGNVLFASGLPKYVQAGTASSSATATSPPSAVESYSIATAGLAMGLYSLGQGTNLTAPELGSVAYRNGVVSIPAAGVSVAPLWSAACTNTKPVWPHPLGQCQCAKGLNTFFIRPLKNVADNQSNIADSMFSFRHAGCGPAFVPLPPVTSSAGLTNTEIGIIAGGAAVAVGAVIAGAMIAKLFCFASTSRDHSNAPKDGRQAFTMVFTDIQSSTRLWAQAPELMGDALDAHHNLLRRAVQKHNGYEVKTIGDSFMVAFKDAQNAVDFAFAVQVLLYSHDFGSQAFDDVYCEALREVILQQKHDMGRKSNANAEMLEFKLDDPEDYPVLWNGLRVRVGVHYGTGNIRYEESTRGYDYYGTVVNTAARVEGVGHGGQILLTEAAFQAVGEAALQTMRAAVTPLGPQPLRGLPEPVPLYQVLPSEFDGRMFPPLRLDVENDVEEDSAGSMDISLRKDRPPRDSGSEVPTGESPASRRESGGGTNDNASQQVLNNLTLDDLTNDLVKQLRFRTRGGGKLCGGVYEATVAMLSAMKPQQAKQTMKALATAWRADSVWTSKKTHVFVRAGIPKENVHLLATIGRVVKGLEVTTGASAITTGASMSAGADRVPGTSGQLMAVLAGADGRGGAAMMSVEESSLGVSGRSGFSTSVRPFGTGSAPPLDSPRALSASILQQ